MAKELGCQGNGRPWAAQGNILVIENGSSDGGGGKAQTWEEGLTAFRFTASGRDAVDAELLWNKAAERNAPGRLIARDGVLYGTSRDEVFSFELLTGKQLAKKRLPRNHEKVHHLTAIAGDHLLGHSHVNHCFVVELGPNGSLGDIEVNRLGERRYEDYDFFNEGTQIFISGNRIFIRSYTNIYCIGDPKQTMRLSEAHR